MEIANIIIRNEVKEDCREMKIFTTLLNRNFVLLFFILVTNETNETGTWKKAFTQVKLARVIDFSHMTG